MATLCLKEMGKLLWEGKEKSLQSWLSQFSVSKLRQPTGQTFFLTFQRNFPISFKPKVAIPEFFWKTQRKTWYSISGLDAMPLSLKNMLLRLLLSKFFLSNLKFSFSSFPLLQNHTQNSTWPTLEFWVRFCDLWDKRMVSEFFGWAQFQKAVKMFCRIL